MSKQQNVDGGRTESTSQDHEYKKRKKTFQDYVNTTGGIVAILATLGAAGSYASGRMPWLEKEVYAKDWTANDERVTKLEDGHKELRSITADIQRNGLLTLQLQLQGRIDNITVSMDRSVRDPQQYSSLRDERNALQQQLDEIKRNLNRR